ncbi:hypothetical protein NPIL_61151 [Nephila pilipes]|uniref:Uncharacterized protein n=1 Tax=Nephila pilipes TaxID=299642 RepID=A0A8X6P4P5_NEPPI|nr:hypothetical protein NPIL_61151 [Nephila pilipes]
MMPSQRFGWAYSSQPGSCRSPSDNNMDTQVGLSLPFHFRVLFSDSAETDFIRTAPFSKSNVYVLSSKPTRCGERLLSNGTLFRNSVTMETIITDGQEE